MSEPSEPPARVIFLDRDGTINVDHHYVHRWDQWQFTDGAVEALRRLRAAGFRLVVVSNQSGIARGYFGAEEVQTLHAELQRHLAAEGVTLEALLYCPHGSRDECQCRKPRVGLARQFEASIRGPVDYAASWTIGDKPSDIEFGRSLGTRTALIRSEYWNPSDLEQAPPDIIADSLSAAAERLLSFERGRNCCW